jgi:collagenase-like PrtC family protease
MVVKASLSELSIARQLLRSSASFSCYAQAKLEGETRDVKAVARIVQTSRALIWSSNAAARRDVVERTWLRELEERIRSASWRRRESAVTPCWMTRCQGQGVKRVYDLLQQS